MSFFNWGEGEGEGGGRSVVSGYFWIYVVVTLCFTLLTIGPWYYFNVYRRTHHQRRVGEVICGV